MWKIVIIDDDFQVAKGLRKAIPWEELDAEFAGEAIDGESGLALIKEVNPDIVLTDIYMPVMNGIQMIEELKKRREFVGRFVILSGYNDFEYARTAIRLGVDDYLTKPVTVDQIRSVLRRTIEKLEETYLSRLESDQTAAETIKEQRQEEVLLALLNGWTLPGDPPVFACRLKEQNSMILVMEVLRNERIQSLSLADWNLFKFAVSNIADEVLSEQWKEAIFVWLFGNYAAMLLPSAEEESPLETYQHAKKLGMLLVNNMRAYLGLEVRIGLGKVNRGWEGIKGSADEAMQQLLGAPWPIADGTPDLKLYYHDIAKALQEKRDEEAVQLINQYIEERTKFEINHEPMGFRMLATEVWTLLHNAMLMSNLPGLQTEEEGQIMRDLALMTEPHRIVEWFQGQIHSLRKTQQIPPIQEKHRKAVQFMIEYVHQHYAEDITLEQLASQLYISKNYLNQLFKRVTGETFTNYVIRVRIEKAKALLLDGNYLIYEVSEKVGYQNVPYFSTLFKKYCGVSPSEITKR